MIGQASGPVDLEISDPTRLVERPVVSVLLLAYNHGPYIAQAIESVLGQRTGFPVELLIGEDCSADETREIALHYQRQYPESIRLITAESNVGLFRNWKRLLAAARGEFIAHLDGDDYWLPDKLDRQTTCLRDNPDCAAVYANAIAVDRAGNRLGLFNNVGDWRFDLPALLRGGNFLNTSSMLFRAPLRNSLLEIDRLFIDYRVHLRLARAGLLLHLAEPLAAYRVDAVGSMISGANDQVRQCYWEAIMDVPRNLVTDEDFAQGILDFLRRVLFRALRTRSPGLLRKWTPTVFSVSPYTGMRTAIKLAWSVVRAASLELRGYVVTIADRNHGTVLYRR